VDVLIVVDVIIIKYLRRIIQSFFAYVHQEIPDGDWYCANCTCRICGNLVIDKDTSDLQDLLQCSLCEHKCKYALYDHVAL